MAYCIVYLQNSQYIHVSLPWSHYSLFIVIKQTIFYLLSQFQSIWGNCKESIKTQETESVTVIVIVNNMTICYALLTCSDQLIENNMERSNTCTNSWIVGFYFSFFSFLKWPWKSWDKSQALVSHIYICLNLLSTSLGWTWIVNKYIYETSACEINAEFYFF